FRKQGANDSESEITQNRSRSEVSSVNKADNDVRP
ncbi:jg25749, partial [Pararge aegeria aegeria]